MKCSIFLTVLPPALVTALIAWEAASLPLTTAHDLLVPQSKTCTAPVHFKVAFPYDDSPVKPIDSSEAYTFMINGWLSADVCQKGTLLITGQGQIADGAPPILQVALNSQLIWKGEFSRLSTVEIPIPRKGHLTVGYFNDFYSSDYRNAFLERVRFQSATCQTFAVNVPADAGGGWNAQTQSLGWLFATPITLKTCSAGSLIFNASGRKGGKAFATLEVKQDGREIRRIQLSDQPQEVEIAVTAQPLEIRIANPYFQEIGDRNLTLRKIQFVPAR
ncbi:hypothetical protein Dcae01_02998 [Deinococcus caeni]|uniref:Uncharacterized protein n=1 Tax=Deinococcus caeni TaxID=569127 RepID=A0ABP9UFG6_9DEIO